MPATKLGSLVPVLALLFLALGALLLARAPAASLPSITLPAVHQAAASRYAIHSNWGEIELDVDGAHDHAVAKHGAAGAEALQLARAGYCTEAYLECSHDWSSLVDGVRGYLVCRLSDGRLGLVPFLADEIAGRLVAMTAYPVRPGYEEYVAARDGCAPVELIALVLGGIDYADND